MMVGECCKCFAVVSQLQDGLRGDEFYHLNLRTKCIQKLAAFPTVVEGRAVGVFRGRPVACGGRIGDQDSAKPTTCYEYVPGSGKRFYSAAPQLLNHI